jgi:uncharacterized membrane protein HdeD (DUF308 family)
MRTILKNWWVLTIKGLLTFTFGIAAVATPISTVLFFSRVFGILMIMSGIMMVMLSQKGNKKYDDHNWKLTEGFIDLILGLIIVSYPEISAAVFISLISIWISFMGILQIFNGYRLRGLYNHYWILMFNGILALAFMVFIITQPLFGIVTLIILLGLQAIVFGGFLIISSFYIRKIFRDLNTEIPHKFGEEANQELSYY